MKLTNNFSSEEFEKSATAKARGIDNTIPPIYRDNVLELAKQLQVIRDEWQAPIIISSGYRCEKLNKAVGGASNSDHKYAAAADIHTKEDSPAKNKELFVMIISLVKLNKLSLRQIIDEHNYTWLHISVNHEFNKHKENEVLHIK